MVSAQFTLKLIRIITLYTILEQLTQNNKKSLAQLHSFNIISTKTRTNDNHHLFLLGHVQMFNAKIRVLCNSLNSYLCRKNVVPRPSCSCGEFESDFHFFLYNHVLTYNTGTHNRYLEAPL